jgi:YidC/Oxa1 family membrane protein insertase
VDRNLFLAFALSLAILVLWSTFVEPPRPKAPATESSTTESAAPEAQGGAPAGGHTSAPAPLAPVAGAQATPVAGPVPAEPLEPVTFETRLFQAEFDRRGAGIRRWSLRTYDTGPRDGRRPVELVTGESPDAAVLATPFQELGFGDLSQAPFTLEASDANTLAFLFERSGVTIRKIYRFDPDSYGFALRVRVENHSAAPIAPSFGVSWPVAQRPGQDFHEESIAVLHEGSVERKPVRSFGKAGFFGGEPKKLMEFPREVDWAGMDATYFLGAVLPDDPAQANARFSSTDPGHAAVVQVFFDPVSLPPGHAAEHVYRGYLGPKVRADLEAMGSGLVRSVDVGWAWVSPLTHLFSFLLHLMRGLVGNYGVAIIVLTVLVRLVTAPLTNRQMRSMERMRSLSPRLQELREKYPDDRQKQSEEMMRLYRQEGVNPLGGCLPMALQLPVFVGLYYALRSSIDLRHAHFFGWIDDLSAPDALFTIPGLGIPLRVLPLIMGVTMLVQQRITPMQNVDPAQQKMMSTVMPIMMTVVFYQFPSGLVLYWMVSNVLAITHQLWIGRGMRAAAAS